LGTDLEGLPCTALPAAPRHRPAVYEAAQAIAVAPTSSPSARLPPRAAPASDVRRRIAGVLVDLSYGYGYSYGYGICPTSGYVYGYCPAGGPQNISSTTAYGRRLTRRTACHVHSHTRHPFAGSPRGSSAPSVVRYQRGPSPKSCVRRLRRQSRTSRGRHLSPSVPRIQSLSVRERDRRPTGLKAWCKRGAHHTSAADDTPAPCGNTR